MSRRGALTVIAVLHARALCSTVSLAFDDTDAISGATAAVERRLREN